jgi:hypothetical protein
MAPYFACYRCSDTKKAIQALDMDADGSVDWNEFYIYIKWAIRKNPHIILINSGVMFDLLDLPDMMKIYLKAKCGKHLALSS